MSQENLEKIIAQQATTIQNLTDEIKLLREQVAYLTQKRYGKSSEQMPLNGQTSLFDEPLQLEGQLVSQHAFVCELVFYK